VNHLFTQASRQNLASSRFFLSGRVAHLELEDTKAFIRIRISMKNRQHNGQKKSTKGQTTIYKAYAYSTKDRVTRTPLKTGCELRCSGRVSISCSISDSTKTSKIILNIIRKLKRWATRPDRKKRV
jgi:hypothetical protein